MDKAVFCLTLCTIAALGSCQVSCVELPFSPARFTPVKISGPFVFATDSVNKQGVAINGGVIQRLKANSPNATISGGSTGYAVGANIVSSSSAPAAWNLKSGTKLQFPGSGILFAVNGQFAVGTSGGSAKVFNLSTLQSTALQVPTGGFASPLSISGRSVAGEFISFSNNQRHAYYWPDFAGPGVDLTPTGAVDSSLLSTDGVQQGGQFAIPGVSGNVRHPAVWNGTAASVTDLALPDTVDGYVVSVLAGYQLGLVTDSIGVNHTVLWHGSAGNFVDLNQFPPAGRSAAPIWPLGLTLLNGRLLAYGVCDSTDRVYRWTIQ